MSFTIGGGNQGRSTSSLSPGIAEPITNQNVPTRVWNAANFAATTDRAKIVEAIAEANKNNGGTVWLGGKTGWEVSTSIKVPKGIRIVGSAIGLVACVLQAEANIFIFELGEAGDGSEITVEYVCLKAKTKQTSGGGIAWATASTGTELKSIWFGNNLFISVECAPAGVVGDVNMEYLHWESGKGFTKGIIIGDGTHHVVGVKMSNIEGAVNEQKDMKVWLEINFTDTFTLTSSLFVVGEEGVVVGNKGVEKNTGLKFTTFAIDSMKSHGWNINNTQDMKCVNCNAQTCGEKLVGRGVFVNEGNTGFKWYGGTIQNNANHGIQVGFGSKHTDFFGVDITNNNRSAEGGTGIVFATCTFFSVRFCRIGNFYPTLAAKQERAILVEGAALSKEFSITDNEFIENTNAEPLRNEGTGANILIQRNKVAGSNRNAGTPTKRKVAEAITANANSDVQLTFTFETKTATRTVLEVLIGAVVVATIDVSVAATGTSAVPFTVDIPATQTYEVKVKEGTLEPAGEYTTSQRNL